MVRRAGVAETMATPSDGSVQHFVSTILLTLFVG